jgi:colanic acid biosynthesis glycosyl transferase WcaI
MRVLILSQYYTPEPIPKPVELAAELRARGHEVSVITGLPNYPSGDLYPGYRLGLLQREVIDGVPVVRTFEFPYHGTRALGRILNYVSFMCSAPLGCLRTSSFDVVYVWHPPLTVGVAAWLIGRWRGVPFVYDVQDIWPESALLAGMMREGVLVRALRRMERFVYRRAHHLLVVTEGARRNLLAKGVPPDRVSVMPHWVDDDLFAPVGADVAERERTAHGWDGRFVVVFAGNLGLVQGLDTVIAAAEQLPRHSPVTICLIGDGADRPRLETMVAERRLERRVQFIDRQPSHRMPPLFAAADALLVHLRHSDLSNLIIPTKTLAYLAAGKPIVMAMQGAAAEIVESSGAGIVVTPENAEALAAAIERLRSLPAEARAIMGERGRKYLAAQFAKREVIPKYEALLQHAAATARAPS